MALYRRKETNVWWMDYTDAEGKRVRASTGTESKLLAQQLLDRTKAEVWEQRRLGVKPQVKFEKAVQMFLEEKRHCRTIDTYEERANWWLERFRGLPLNSITQELIIKAIKVKRAEVSPATCNRLLATLKTILRLACRKYEWIDRVPAMFFYEEPKGRTRWLQPHEIARLLDALPEHERDIAMFSFATGLRQGNIRRLRWEQVNLNLRVIFIDGKEMKNGRDHGIPLNEAALDVLRRNIGKHWEYVFTFRGKPIRASSSVTWKRALEKAGIEDFRRHDMRHTWASMLVQSGVPDNVIQTLGAWETAKMVKRYAHHSAESMRPFAKQVDAALASATSQFASQEGDRQRLKEVV